ncbi:hypothetical protein SDC9_45371 [bioreactor metagenome]|uniref:Uncharacterized protein n=1 Tax=bioreactor metagenome TaxID=1076179 RepID=A0A644W5U7_9ZZZZ
MAGDVGKLDEKTKIDLMIIVETLHAMSLYIIIHAIFLEKTN